MAMIEYEEDDERPIRRNKEPKNNLRLKVLVFDIKTGEQCREHNTGWNRDNRLWFSSLVLWAAKNGKSIEILNVKDDDGE